MRQLREPNIQMMIEEMMPDVINDEPTMYVLKTRLQRLNRADLNTFVMYANIGSYEKLGKLLGVSRTTIYKKIHAIRRAIL